MNELDVVELVEDLPAHALKAGAEGAIVHVHKGGTAFEVEFFSLTGDTLDVVTVAAKQVRPVWSPEPIFAVGELVALREELPDHGLVAGDTGSITHIVPDGSAYVVAFATLRGQTVAVVEVAPVQVRRVGEREIAHARPLDSLGQPG